MCTLTPLNRHTPSGRIILFTLASLLFISGIARADTIYCETFGIPPTASADASATNFDWQRFDNNGIVSNGVAVNFSAVGRPVNVVNTNAGPNLDGTFVAYTNGIFYMGATPSPSLGLTTEYSFDPANYVAGSIVFSWYEGNNTAPHFFRLLIRQGGNWYVSAQTFTSAAVALTSFGTSAQLETLTYDPTAANWLTLNFNGGYVLGATPGTGHGTNSTLGALSVGSAPGSNLSGVITGFGVYGENGGTGTGNRRIDSFTIQATPLNGPPPPAIVASNQNVSLLFNTSTNIALQASNTNATALTFYIATNPVNGTLGTLNSNLVTYTPNSNYIGSDSFTFYASDGANTSAVATVSITVTNVEILYPSSPQITKDGTAIVLTNYVSMPLSTRTVTTYPPTMDFGDQLARVNFLRSEPTNAPLSSSRLVVCDNNRNLYFLDKATKTFATYINFEEVFPKFDNNPGYAGGLVTFQFDPGYATNGIFYTVHTEDPSKAGSAAPTNGSLPGLDVSTYTTTTAVNPPLGSVVREAVLVEWTDTNIINNTFEGTAREILRVGFTSNIHPMGDLLYNPLAQPGDADYRNLYVADGDGGAGESSSTHPIPQRLDAIEGKILRITPDLNLRPADQLSDNGRYRIPTTGPNPNPFVNVILTGLRKEIFTYGHRNCHRISWDPLSNLIVENEIGLHSWEEVNIIHQGMNYGYAEREGTEQLFVGGANNGKTGSQVGVAFTNSDALTVTGLPNLVTPIYPVAMYSHRDGDAISSGFVYRGKLLPQLYGKYIFGDITTGRIFYCDFADMVAKDDGVRTTVSTIHELQVVFNGQARRLFDVVSDQYKAKGGTSSQALPGSANATAGSDIDGIPYNKGRADIRFGVDSDGEIYVMSKSDGMIRRMVAVVVPPTISSVTNANGTATLSWSSISNRVYRVQYKNSLSDATWTDLPGDVSATGATSSKMDSSGGTNRFYRLYMP
jgi:hypothetical protein